MELSIFQVDAFSSKVFGGNPAAVCPLENWLPDKTLQAIASENNLAETAYFVRTGDRFHLRWFTPAVEMDLCGHATLASAFVLFEELSYQNNKIYFDTKSGELVVRKDDDLLVMDFPSRPPKPFDIEPGLREAVGGKPVEILAARDCLLAYETEEEVLALQPDMSAFIKVKAKLLSSRRRRDGTATLSRAFSRPSWAFRRIP